MFARVYARLHVCFALNRCSRSLCARYLNQRNTSWCGESSQGGNYSCLVKQRYLGLGRSHERWGGSFWELPGCPWARHQTLSDCGGQLTHSKPLPLQPCADCVVTYITCMYCVNIFPPWLTCSSNSMFLSVLWGNNYFLCQHTIWTFFTCPLSLLYPVNWAGSFCSAVLTQKKRFSHKWTN